MAIPDDAFVVVDEDVMAAWVEDGGDLVVRVVMPGTAEHAQLKALRDAERMKVAH